MRNFFSKPHNWLLLPALIVLLTAVFDQRSVDLQIADTYFIMPSYYLYIPVAFFFIIAWLLYRTTDQYLYSKALSWVTIGMMLLSFALICLLRLLPQPEAQEAAYLTIIGIAVGTLPLLAQLVFIANILLGVIKKQRP